MAKQKFEGPYKVKQIKENQWEVGDISSGQWLPLNPRRRFQGEYSRQSAYRTMANLNKKHQQEDTESEENLVKIAC